MDICALSPVETTRECRAPIGATTFKEGGSSGIPLSSALKIWQGFSVNPFSSRVLSKDQSNNQEWQGS